MLLQVLQEFAIQDSVLDYMHREETLIFGKAQMDLQVMVQQQECKTLQQQFMAPIV